MIPHLHLLTLGSPALLSGAGEQIRFRTRKHFAVLIRLALAAGRKCSREELMEMLWPQVPERLARHSLAQAVTVIKAKVGREHVLVQRNAVALADGAVEADAIKIDQEPVPVRGPFLDGFEIPGARGFDQWKDEWNARLLPKIRDSLVRQMDAGRRVGNFTNVEEHARMLLALDPLSEDGVQGAMEARAWVGDRSNALKTFARYEEQLATELGAKPGPDLIRMADLLREGRRSTPRPAVVSEPPARRERRMEAETIIGRSREFSTLYDTWLEARKGAPRVMVLTGDPGIGKTTLTNAFLSSCQMEGAVVARAQAYDAERDLPFAVLAELVRQLTIQRAIGGAEPEALSELSRVCSEVGSVFPGVPKPADWAAEIIPLRLADALLKTVTAAAEESPVVLVVDDVHAVDSSSAAILHVVARKLAATRVMLVLAGRPTDLRAGGAAAALASDGTIAGLKTLDLDALTHDAAREMVSRLTQEPSVHGSPPIERILHASSGNPLALELLAREWVDHGPESLLSDLEAINTRPAPALGIPRTIRSVFEREVLRLDPRTRSVLDLAAVLGRRLHEVDLYRVVELSEVQAAGALSRLRDERLLRDVQGVLEFRNELIRAQAYYAISSSARQHLHRLVGEALAGRRADEKDGLALEIAWHYLRGNDLKRAIPASIDGATQSLEGGAPKEAEQVLSALIQQQGFRGPIPQVSLLLSEALIEQSKAEAAGPHLHALQATASLGLEERAQAAAMRAKAEFILARESGVGHSAAAEEAFAVAREARDPDLVARSLYFWARTRIEIGDPNAVAEVRGHIAELRSHQEYSRVPMLHFAEAYCEFVDGSAQFAEECINRALEASHMSRKPADLILLLNGLAISRHHQGRCDAACEASLRALDLAKRIGDDAAGCTIRSNLCAVLNSLGRPDESIRFGKESIQLGFRALRQPRIVLSYTNLADAYILKGMRDEALACLAEASTLMRGDSNWEARMGFYSEGACISLALGDLSTALHMIEVLEQTAGLRTVGLPNWGVFEKLRAFRAMHSSGSTEALDLAMRARTRFRGKNVFHYIDANAAIGWIERKTTGTWSEETRNALRLLDDLSLSGKRALLSAQGFLD